MVLATTADFWVIRTFNPAFFTVMAGFGLLFFLLWLLSRKQTLAVRARLLSALMLLTCVSFILYKRALFLDQEYSLLTADGGIGEFSWWKELPLHMCNMNMLIIPFAVLTGNRRLMSFSFFSGTLGALMALLMPAIGFDGYSFFIPRIYFFFGIHWMIFFAAISLVSLKLFRPTYKDILPTLLTFFEVEVVIFLFNMLLRLVGLCDHANYWYCVETEGNFLLELFHKLLPWPFLFTLPAYPIMMVYMLAVTSLVLLLAKQKKAV